MQPGRFFGGEDIGFEVEHAVMQEKKPRKTNSRRSGTVAVREVAGLEGGGQEEVDDRIP